MAGVDNAHVAFSEDLEGVPEDIGDKVKGWELPHITGKVVV